MMFYYRADLFAKYGLTVPTTWASSPRTRTKLHAEAPGEYLTTFSSDDPGGFAGLSQQAGASGGPPPATSWKVGIDDAASKKVADFWGGSSPRRASTTSRSVRPAWNKALNNGTLHRLGVAPSGRPASWSGNAASNAGKWAMAAAAAVDRRGPARQVTGAARRPR